jgi:hypothetical protein
MTSWSHAVAREERVRVETSFGAEGDPTAPHSVFPPRGSCFESRIPERLQRLNEKGGNFAGQGRDAETGRNQLWNA